MLIKNIQDICLDRRGAIHVGGHDGEERFFYNDYFKRVVYFEPNRELYIRLAQNIRGFSNQMAINMAVGQQEGFATLNISNNDGQSSSLLELGTHAQEHPNVKFIAKDRVQVIRLDTVFEGLLNAFQYNFLNVDVQGMELDVIKSAGDYIQNFKYVYCEVNRAELYKGCCLVGEIDEYLAQYGFMRTLTEWTKHNWGDALYVKSE